MTTTKWTGTLTRLVCTACIATSAHVSAQNRIPAGYRAGQATPIQILQLPKFCWWEYDAKYAATYGLVQNCGVYVNHYCSGEVDFLNSKDASKPMDARFAALQRALTNTEYTLNGTRDHPSCSIRPYVARKYQEIRAAYVRFGRPMPPSVVAAPKR